MRYAGDAGIPGSCQWSCPSSCEKFTARAGIVLATGGGAVLVPANRALLRERGFVIWLQASVEQQLQRLARDRKRPLLDAPDRRKRLEQLALERDPVYAELADCSAGGADESCDHAAARIAALLETQWQRTPTLKENA